jgi:hypothetical protein
VDELSQLSNLYERLRIDAREVMKDLAYAQVLYLSVGFTMLISGAVLIAFGISSAVFTFLAVEMTFFPLAMPISSSVISLVIGLLLVSLSERFMRKGNELKKRYGGVGEMKDAS